MRLCIDDPLYPASLRFLADVLIPEAERELSVEGQPCHREAIRQRAMTYLDGVREDMESYITLLSKEYKQ